MSELTLATSPKSFSLLSFNVHLGGVYADFSGQYDLSSVLRTLSHDVMVFQELSLSPTGAPSLSEMLPSEYNIIEPSPPIEWVNDRTSCFSLAIASRFPVLSTRILPLPVLKDVRRSAAILTVLDTPAGRVSLIGVHLTTEFLPSMSAVQVARLGMYARAIKGPLIIAGDHNLWRTAATRLLPGSLRPSFRSPTWPAHRPLHQIDHIWVRDLHSVGQALPPVGSDHLPVSAVISPA